MRVRVWGFGLVSQYALCHLLLSLFLATCGPAWEWFVGLVLGFPLLYPLLLFGEAGAVRSLGPTAGVTLVVVLGVTNSYLWGLAAAAVHRRAERWAGHRAPPPPAPPL
jgi:hypothetical protein